MHFLIFFIVIPAAAVFVFCLAYRWIRTRDPIGEILADWAAGFARWIGSRYYALLAAGDRDAIDAIPPPATAGPAPAAAPLPPPPPAGGTAGPQTSRAPAPVIAGGDIPAMAQSDLMHIIGALVAQASNGDIKDVRRVIATLAAAMDDLAGGVSALSRRLAEPDKDYGNEIWEPLQVAAAQVMAASLHCGDSDAELQAMLNRTVAELAESAQHAPHNSQFNGGA